MQNQAAAPAIDEIVARVLEGDVELFGEVVRRHGREVWRVAAHMLADPATTENVVQEAFVNAYRRLGQYRPGTDFGAWLRTIARNLVRDEVRRSMRESGLLAEYRTLLLTELEAGDEGGEEDRRMKEALAECRKALAPPAALALDLRYQQGLRSEAIAAALGRTAEATRQLLTRVRIGLKQCIERRLQES